MIKVLIIDDEALARLRIRRLLEDRAEIDIAGECKSGEAAIAAIRQKRPDLIFLDIQMKDMTGFEVLDALRPEEWPMVIFVTAFDQYAIRAFDVFAFDYLTKPFKEERFELSVNKALVALGNQRQPAKENNLEQLLAFIRQMAPADQGPSLPGQVLPIRQAGKISFVEFKAIHYINASSYYVEIQTAGKKHLLRETLSNLEEKLPAGRFFRIHRSTLINLDFLKELLYENKNELAVRMKDDQVFRVSRSYRDELLKRLGV